LSISLFVPRCWSPKCSTPSKFWRFFSRQTGTAPPSFSRARMLVFYAPSFPLHLSWVFGSGLFCRFLMGAVSASSISPVAIVGFFFSGREFRLFLAFRLCSEILPALVVHLFSSTSLFFILRRSARSCSYSSRTVLLEEDGLLVRGGQRF